MKSGDRGRTRDTQARFSSCATGLASRAASHTRVPCIQYNTRSQTSHGQCNHIIHLQCSPTVNSCSRTSEQSVQRGCCVLSESGSLGARLSTYSLMTRLFSFKFCFAMLCDDLRISKHYQFVNSLRLILLKIGARCSSWLSGGVTNAVACIDYKCDDEKKISTWATSWYPCVAKDSRILKMPVINPLQALVRPPTRKNYPAWIVNPQPQLLRIRLFWYTDLQIRNCGFQSSKEFVS